MGKDSKVTSAVLVSHFLLCKLRRAGSIFPFLQKYARKVSIRRTRAAACRVPKAGMTSSAPEPRPGGRFTLCPSRKGWKEGQRGGLRTSELYKGEYHCRHWHERENQSQVQSHQKK